jgi:penicillin-binding protein 2
VPIASADPANVVRVVDPVVRSHVDLPDGTRGPIVDGLTGVTRTGTAGAAFAGFNQSNFAIVGKTGTAQVNGKADTSVFASYAPANDPKYAVAAVLEESGFGADAAAPVVRHVYEYLSGAEQSVVKPVDSGKQD